MVLSDETMSDFAGNDLGRARLCGHRADEAAAATARARTGGLRLQAGPDQAAIEELRASHDLVVAADGLNSRTRQAHADRLGAQIDMRRSHFV